MSRTKRKRILVLFAAGCSFPPSPLFAQTAISVQAELIQSLNARKVKVGDPILAKVVLPWKSPECDLRSGAIIQGHVVTQKPHSKTEKTSEIGITFESGQCGGPESEALDCSIAVAAAPSLFTFNPHKLVQRSAAEAISSHSVRVVRGVLIDLEKKEIVRTVDWRVLDSGRYLWPIRDNRVLVHVGHELRVYGPGLQVFDRIPLEEPLAFLQISPASEFFAVGVIHERHTREIHRQLEKAELREPEEDVEIRLLDSRFRSVTTIMRSSRFAPPVLLNEGEVHISSIARNRWQIMANTWSGQRRVLAVASSTCTPHAESMPGNLLFVVGCEGQTRWYRILHGNGQVALKGRSSPSEVGQTAGGNIGSNVFAIRIAESAKSRSLQSVFKPSEVTSSHVAVYWAKNGHRIFSIEIPDLVPAVQVFAISPREDQMALLKAREIAFYHVQVGE